MPVDEKTLENEIKQMIAEIIEVEPEKITTDAKFVEDLGMDSMMALEILASIEKKYRVQIPEEKLTSITNLKATVDLAKELMEAKIRAMQHMFYMDVYSYIQMEYSLKIERLFTNSPISGDIVDLVNEYFWGGNTVQFTAGQIADLLRSKYLKNK